MQIVAFRPSAGVEFMATDEERQTEAQRYTLYTLAAMIAAALAAFIFLFNFTTFFRLATPL